MSGFKSKKIIFILGGPGSGKGTQSNLIKKKYDIGYTVAGDLLRIEAKKGTELGNQITEIMKSGQVASQEVAIRLLKKAILLLKEDIVRQEKEITLIDGFPRSVEQGIAFEKDVVKGRALIFLDVPDDILFERLMKRSENSGRIDDNPETIKKRIQFFHSATQPVYERFKSDGRSYLVDGNRTPDVVFKEISEIFDKILK